MTRSRSAVLAVLVAALSLSVPAAASAGAGAKLDPSRIFDRNAESFFSLAPAARTPSTFATALFHVAVTDSFALPDRALEEVSAGYKKLTEPGR